MKLKSTMIGLAAAAALASSAPNPAFAKPKGAPGNAKPCSSMVVRQAPAEPCSLTKKRGSNEIQELSCHIAIPGNRFRRVSFSGQFLAGIKDGDLPAVVAANMVKAAEGKLDSEGCTATPLPPAASEKAITAPKGVSPQKPTPAGKAQEKPKPGTKPQDKPKADDDDLVLPPSGKTPAPQPAPKLDDDDHALAPSGKAEPAPEPSPKPGVAPGKGPAEVKDEYTDVRKGKMWLAFPVKKRPKGKEAILDNGNPWAMGSKDKLKSRLQVSINQMYNSELKRGAPGGKLIARVLFGTDGYVRKVAFQGDGLDYGLAEKYTMLFRNVVFQRSRELFTLEFGFVLKRTESPR